MSKLKKKILAPQGTLPNPEDCVIELGSGYAAIVDSDDFEELSKYRWFAKKSANCIYAVRRVVAGGKAHLIRMHRVIAKTPAGFETHHKNRNSLDNRKINLDNASPENHKNFHKFSVDNSDNSPI